MAAMGSCSTAPYLSYPLMPRVSRSGGPAFVTASDSLRAAEGLPVLPMSGCPFRSEDGEKARDPAPSPVRGFRLVSASGALFARAAPPEVIGECCGRRDEHRAGDDEESFHAAVTRAA